MVGKKSGSWSAGGTGTNSKGQSWGYGAAKPAVIVKSPPANTNTKPAPPPKK